VLGKGVVCQGHAGLRRQPHRHLLDPDCGVNAAFDHGLTVEEADAIAGRPMGVPKTGIFGLLDLVGSTSCRTSMKSLRSNPAEGRSLPGPRRPEPLLEKMIAEGYTGRKGKGGFYRMNKDGAKRAQGGDRPRDRRVRTSPRAPLVPVVGGGGQGRPASAGRTADKGGGDSPGRCWRRRSPTPPRWCPRSPTHLSRSIRRDEARLQLEVRAVRAGSTSSAPKGRRRLEKEGRAVRCRLCSRLAGPHLLPGRDGKRQHLTHRRRLPDVVRPEGVLLLWRTSSAAEAAAQERLAALWDIGDGVVCFEFTRQDERARRRGDEDLIGKAIGLVPRSIRRSSSTTRARISPPGANLGLALFAANIGAWPMIEELVRAAEGLQGA
jgi:3-hydroxyacyl-CoA dehydrogenase